MEMGMDESTADQVGRYLAELAVNDPGQLPCAIFSVVQFSVMVAVVNALWYGIAGMLEEWEGSLNELI